MTKPCFIHIENDYSKIEEVLNKENIKKLLLVCGRSFEKTGLYEFLKNLKKNGTLDFTVFSDYTSNPELSSAVKAKDFYISEGCQGILAAGGGSAMDTSKCVRLLLSGESDIIDKTTDSIMGDKKSEILKNSNRIPFFVIPTTAGSGSEATKFAVVYSNDEKLSLSGELCLPDVVFYDSTLLETLPMYQRISTFLDAFCHCIESLWSINSTETSIEYASKALEVIIKYNDLYISNDPEGNRQMQKAAGYAGMAINISKTTAAHAMSYRLTKMYGIPHGISAGLCLEHVWKHNITNKRLCCDSRGTKQLDDIFERICGIFGYEKIEDALSYYSEKLKKFSLSPIPLLNKEDLDILAGSVNIERLNNSPVPLSFQEIKNIYGKILV